MAREDSTHVDQDLPPRANGSTPAGKAASMNDELNAAGATANHISSERSASDKEADAYERSNLSANQFLFWTAQQLQPELTPFNVAVIIWIDESIDVGCFRRAFQTLLNSSDAFRTVIEES